MGGGSQTPFGTLKFWCGYLSLITMQYFVGKIISQDICVVDILLNLNIYVLRISKVFLHGLQFHILMAKLFHKIIASTNNQLKYFLWYSYVWKYFSEGLEY